MPWFPQQKPGIDPLTNSKGEQLLEGDTQKLASDPRESVPKTLRHVQTRVRPGASATEEAQAVNIVMFLLLAEGSTVFTAIPHTQPTPPVEGWVFSRGDRSPPWGPY